MNKTYITVAICFSLLAYVIFDLYQDKNSAQKEAQILSDKISQLEQVISKNNQIIADNELSKRELENQSIERQEQINEQLKDNDCANRFVPMPVSASLYSRAKGIRESTDTSQSIK